MYSSTVVLNIRNRSLRLPGRGCDPSLIRFYLAEVCAVLAFSVDHLRDRLSPQHCPFNSPRFEAREHPHHGDGPHHADRLRHDHLQHTGADSSKHHVWHDSLSGSRGSFRLSVFTRSSRATRCRLQWTCGRSGASCTCSSPAASSSRARTSGSEEPLSCRLNVVDSIKHFCVDMLEFPDYVPEVARVRIDDASQLQDLIRQMLNHDPKKRITAQDAIVMSVPLFFLETSVLCRH